MLDLVGDAGLSAQLGPARRVALERCFYRIVQLPELRQPGLGVGPDLRASLSTVGAIELALD